MHSPAVTAPLKLKFGRRVVRVSSYAEASAAYAEARDASGLGGSRWPEGVITRDGVVVARVSYNAKVWGPEPWAPGPKTPLFNPYENDAPLTVEEARTEGGAR